jgi:hypothetical protein
VQGLETSGEGDQGNGGSIVREPVRKSVCGA